MQAHCAENQNESLRHVHVVLVGFDTYAGLPKLNGMVNDVFGWWRCLRALGIWPQNVQIATDRPVEEILRRLTHEHPGDDLVGAMQVFHIPAKGAVEAINGTILSHDTQEAAGCEPAADEESADVARIAVHPRAHNVLLMWSGHGGADSDAPDAPPVLVLPDGESIKVAELVSGLGEVHHIENWTAGDKPWLTAVFTACRSAVIDLGSEGQDSTNSQTFADLGAVALAASSKARPAYEIFVGGEWRGALAWAASTVLSRYETREDGSVALTHAELIHRVQCLLEAIEVDDDPRLFAPLHEANRHILRGYGDLDVGQRQRKAGNTLEIYPTADGELTLAAIKTLTGASLGWLVHVGTDEGDKRHNDWNVHAYLPGHMYFLWSGDPFPGEFRLEPVTHGKKLRRWKLAKPFPTDESVPKLADFHYQGFELKAWVTSPYPWAARMAYKIVGPGGVHRWAGIWWDKAAAKWNLHFRREAHQEPNSGALDTLEFRVNSESKTVWVKHWVDECQM